LLASVNPFLEKLNAEGLQLRHATPQSVQINLGRALEKSMSRETMDRIVDWIAASGIGTVDLTGNAPETVADFRHLVGRLRALPSVRRIIVRCHLALLLEDYWSWVAEFLAAKKVEIVAVLPSRVPEPTMIQRGGDCGFEAATAALRALNRLGYGVAGDLKLNLVVYPTGLQLPRERSQLEAEVKNDLAANFGIVFNQVFVMPNVPVGRVAVILRANKKFEGYLQSLVDAFDGSALNGVPCRDSIHVGWQGEVYDCDYNQQLEMQWRNGHRTFLWDVDPEKIAEREVMTGEHCFACTVRSGDRCASARSLSFSTL
jgi:radical SAM/Cys-rich protein